MDLDEPGAVKATRNAPTISETTKLEFLKVESLYKLLRRTVSGAVIVLVVWQARLAIEALAGEHTILDLFVTYLTDHGLDVTISVAFGFSGVIWGFAERKLRHRKVEYLASRVRELELKLDSKRSTSGLTPEGKTHPDDL